MNLKILGPVYYENILFNLIKFYVDFNLLIKRCETLERNNCGGEKMKS